MIVPALLMPYGHGIGHARYIERCEDAITPQKAMRRAVLVQIIPDQFILIVGTSEDLCRES
jgi:hypothetical protein